MKRRIITSLKCLLAGVLLVGTFSAANAQFTSTTTGTVTGDGTIYYNPGQLNTFNFSVNIQNVGNWTEWVDNIQFTFPAGVNATAAGGVPSPWQGCATGTGNLVGLGTNVVAWRYPNYPGNQSFCGPFDPGTYNFSVTVNIPAGTTGPMTVRSQLNGDGQFNTWGGFTTQITQDLVFQQFIPCSITCPGDLFFNLDPGACTQVVNYNVFSEGICLITGITSCFIDTYAPANIDNWQADFFSFPNSANGVNVGPPDPAGQIKFLDAGCTLEITASSSVSGWCHNGVGWDIGNATPTTVEFDWAFDPGGSGGIDQFEYAIGSPGNGLNDGQNNWCGNPVGYWTQVTPFLNPAPSNGHIVLNLPANASLSFAVAAPQFLQGIQPGVARITNFQFTGTGPAVVEQTSGLPSGSEFPIGVTQNCFNIDVNPAGPSPNDLSCCFDVSVVEFPNPISSLVCNDLVYVSLDEDCNYCLGADGVLEGGPYHCYDDYIVEVDKAAPFGNGPWLPACFTNADVNKTYQVRVTDPETGNKCWGNVKVEDKLAPVLECEEVLLPCNFPSYAPEYLQSATFALKFAASGLNLPTDLAGGESVTFDIPVDIVGIIRDVDVRVRVENGADWGTFVSAISPAGTAVAVWNPGAFICANPLLLSRFDDEGAAGGAVCNDYRDDERVTPQTGAALAQFDGEDSEGTWQITVRNTDNNGFGNVQTVEIAELFLTIEGDFTAGFPNGLTLGQDVQQGPNGTYIVAIGAGTPQMENCSNTTLSYLDTEISDNCASGLTSHINRKWTARDASGNTTTCVQRINKLRPTLDDVIAPTDYDGIDAPFFTCEDNLPIVNGHPNPTPDYIESLGLQGYPWVYGQSTGCSINWEYEDHPIVVCDGTVKYRREWSIIDWCLGDGFIYNQIIKVVDDQGPAIDCPANMTVSTDPFTCCATINLPDVIVEDNCSRINNISGMITLRDPQTNGIVDMVSIGGSLQDFPGNNWWDLDTLANFGWTSCLPIGPHTVTYLVEDDCGNTSTCTFNLTVRDLVPPVASCDETTTIAMGIDDPFDCYGPGGFQNQNPEPLDACNFAGVTWVKASVFDDASYDNCNALKFRVHRMAPYSDCILNLNAIRGQAPTCNFQLPSFPPIPSEFQLATTEFLDSLKFYCCEVGTTQTIVLSVDQLNVDGTPAVNPDGSPVRNQCMIQVEVQDKLKPACLPPAPVTVNCENFDPSLWAYGKAQVSDNCCLDTSKVYQGQCGLSHSVNYALFDTVCNKGTITRTFRAYDCHGFSSSCTQRVIVTYDQDYFIKFPNDAIVTSCDGTGVYGEPIFFGEDCELLGVSYEDEVFTVVPDACFKIERTWTIINWCTYDPNLPCIYVPNPNPNAITNHPTNLPGPTVSAPGTAQPWKSTVVKILPTDPLPGTDYSMFWDKNANCYKYKQIIKIIDGVAPTGTFTVPDCSNQNWYTPNNAQLWNEMYWWDNGLQIHDLCEEPTDLCITATDACSGSNINIEYLLFLDLDGNGSMETVINSVNLGIAGLGWNNVNYNNLNNPNFSGGTPRQFDERPVPANQKYGFSIQETVNGNSKTACVRWNTTQQQNTHVIPELPHGTHKIKWFITDGCGNNKEYEYTFTVKDCKAPTVVCLNGLSVNIMPTGMISLWASDFLQYTEDNCTPNPLKIGIRKCGTGTGFPVDAFGNPIVVVNFTCAELGTQCVELWAIDAAGNADYCETYVIIQDNLGNCPGNSINVSGALKTEMADGVEEAIVNIDGSVSFAPPFSYFDMSDADGVYAVTNNVPVASTFVIAPEKDDNPLNGVTTYDLVLISKHILGLEPLNSPYKMIAADANKSGSITTFDIVELRKLILGIYTELPNNTSWRFVDKSFSFPNANNPFQTAFPETVSIADAMLHQLGEDFAGVKIGDVNSTAVANATMQAEERTSGTAIFDIEDRAVKAGEVFEVNFKSAQALKGFQFTASLNGLKAIEAVETENVTSSNFNMLPENAMAVSIDGAQGFTVRFRAEKAGQLSEMLGVSGSITRAEAYGDAGRLNVAFRFDGKTISGVGFELYQNQPNPFVSRTFVGFFLPEAAEATLSVFDETGRVVYQQKGQFAKGENTIALDRALINTTGVLYYKLETATDSATKKMIQAK